MLVYERTLIFFQFFVAEKQPFLFLPVQSNSYFFKEPPSFIPCFLMRFRPGLSPAPAGRGPVETIIAQSKA